MICRPRCKAFHLLATSFAAVAIQVPTAARSDGGDNPRQASVYQIQGDGAASPLVDQRVTVRGVVVGDFQGSERLNGFFIQDPQGDDRETTSDGVFVYAPDVADVAVGDLVEVSGTVSERFQQTQISRLTNLQILAPRDDAKPLPIAPLRLTLPLQHAGQLEPYEGMLVVLDQPLTVTENRNLDRFGEVVFAADGRLLQPTQVAAPGPDARKIAAANLLNQLIVDDGSTRRNPDPIPYPGGGLAAANTLRLGDRVEGLTGIVSFGFDAYRLQPTQTLRWVKANPRPAAPEPIGGQLKIATFNVLNYFNGDGRGGGFPTERGARSLEELQRQEAKLVGALMALDADVVGLQEIENDGYGRNSAIRQLVDALNAVTGEDTYAFVDPAVSQLGSQPIAVGMLFRPHAVTQVGAAAFLATGAFDADGTEPPDNRNRVPLAVSFRETATGEIFTVAVNHFKSKGKSDLSDRSSPNFDQNDGQGHWNAVRKRAADELIAWLAADPTRSGDRDVLVVGDLNSYAQEDPISVFRAAGYQNLAEAYQPAGETYTNVYSGQSGSLDYIFASPTMTGQATGATTWHVNVDEPPVLDYRMQSKTRQQIQTLYQGDVYRSSDHDPILVGLNLGV